MVSAESGLSRFISIASGPLGLGELWVFLGVWEVGVKRPAGLFISVLHISILILLAFSTDAGETVHYSVCPQEEIANRCVVTFGILVQWSCV
jgi:hypothetical protein|tara:strand:- start:197 stop:472 length:276 start_codon:yes stop_codon:yes gene_type:complete